MLTAGGIAGTSHGSRVWFRSGSTKVQLSAREAEQVGVRGTLYARPDEWGLPAEDTFVPYDSAELAFVIAREAVRELRGITVYGPTTCPVTERADS
ncbi:hypothetical protein ACFT38_28450 [Streptomyces sp. NPDC056975]|uniref:hypothetical protein n=1 Tax=Streptomyces sp. NPDC056975 TaxID=3345985 RepID=UPI00363CE8F5